jgi:hypothetical protein
MDPYSVLGVAPSAGAEEVKAAYRARSRLLHPDVHRDARGQSPQAAHDAFTQLCRAYELALGNLEAARRTFGAVDRSAVVAAAPAAPAPAPAAPVAAATASDGFDWRGTVLLVGLAILGLLFVTDWLPALLAYSAR